MRENYERRDPQISTVFVCNYTNIIISMFKMYSAAIRT